MTRTFAVVTDSTADLPEEWHDRYGIEVVPLKVLFGKETFRDGVDITNEQFFQRLAASPTLPTTSAPSPGEFAEVYRRLANDHDGCVSIHIGAQLSATAEAARLGAQAVEGFKVNVIDSQTVSMPVAFLCRVAAESDSLEAATSEVERRVPKTRVLALLDTLRYLEMGGRLSRAQALIGTMLDLKPLLLVDPSTATSADRGIKAVDRVRTRSRAIPRMVEYFKGDMPVEQVAVMHAQAADEAEQIAGALRKDLPDSEVTVGQIGSVLGTHTGPKALGIVYIKQ
jgi:DegV family protein with EDD domain